MDLYKDQTAELGISAMPKVTVKPTQINRPSTQNGMPFQGFVIIEGTPVDFYGSESAWVRFKTSVES